LIADHPLCVGVTRKIDRTGTGTKTKHTGTGTGTAEGTIKTSS